MNRVAVLLGLLAFTLNGLATDANRVLDKRSLVQVRTLDALPKEVNTPAFDPSQCD
jgi:hypothetical protein